jgi:hypothetical protein
LIDGDGADDRKNIKNLTFGKLLGNAGMKRESQQIVLTRGFRTDPEIYLRSYTYTYTHIVILVFMTVATTRACAHPVASVPCPLVSQDPSTQPRAL